MGCCGRRHIGWSARMRRRYRLLLAGVIAASAIVAIVGLTWISQGSEGPLSSLLASVGTTVASFEHRVLRRGRDDRTIRLPGVAPRRGGNPPPPPPPRLFPRA